MARSRKLRKRIEIWQTNKVADGFGGNTVEAEQITATWADIRTLSLSNKYEGNANEIGIFDPSTAIMVKVRKRNDLTYNAINQYIIYNGQQYNIVTHPTNVDFNNSYIEFIASLEASKGVNPIAPIGGERFPYTFNFILTSKAETIEQVFDGYELRVEGDGGNITSEACVIEYLNQIIN
jgi:SPP1 family predicted phage head-tail adaptor